eukprot:COSAG03_NODE_6444_length_1059_cov_1.608333_2_plen_122_part_00
MHACGRVSFAHCGTRHSLRVGWTNLTTRKRVGSGAGPSARCRAPGGGAPVPHLIVAAPFVGSGVAGKARAVVGVIKAGADMANTANKGLRGVESAAHAGNVNQAINVMRTTARDEFAAELD